MEMGHPLHVFDYNRLDEHRIDVYFAKTGQTFITLDGQERKLDKRHLLIADGNGPVALAGIMGGLESEVTEDTTNVLIESAYFVPAVIRRGSKSLDLSSEASRRFERDTDIDGLVTALDRVTSLIVELAGGTVAKGRIDTYPVKHEPKTIDLSVAFTNRLLGMQLSAKEMSGHLERLGISVEHKQDTLICTVPVNRPDLTQPVDLIEEIARMVGYDNIPAVEGVEVKFESLIDDTQAFFSQVRSTVVPWGFHEHMANTLTRKDYVDLFSEGEAIVLTNPLSSELAYLRTSLLPDLVQAIAFNERRQQWAVRLFEIGAVHEKDDRAYNRCHETFKLGLAVTIGTASGDLHWKKPAPRDVFFLKGVVTRLFRSLNISTANFEPATVRGLGSALHIMIDKSVVGILGEVTPEIRSSFTVGSPIAVAELDLGQLGKAKMATGTEYRDVVPYPIVERDVAMEIPLQVPAARLLDTIREKGGKYFRDARIFDSYSGEGIGEGKRSLAFRLYFQSDDRTLKDEEVDRQVQRIADALQSQHNAQWRQA
jgi:phenylalanyl-tRNA synthetase beta chain